MMTSLEAMLNSEEGMKKFQEAAEQAMHQSEHAKALKSEALKHLSYYTDTVEGQLAHKKAVEAEKH